MKNKVNYIIESYINGQKKQAVNLSLELREEGNELSDMIYESFQIFGWQAIEILLKIEDNPFDSGSIGVMPTYTYLGVFTPTKIVNAFYNNDRRNYQNARNIVAAHLYITDAAEERFDF